MEHDTDSLGRYADELAEIARLDHNYYVNKAPSRDDRALYALRQERLSRIRSEFWWDKYMPNETFRLQFRDNARGTDIVSAPHCLLAHDANNLLGVVLGRCELLGGLMPDNKAAAAHLSEIAEAAQKMASRIHGGACDFLDSRSLG